MKNTQPPKWMNTQVSILAEMIAAIERDHRLGGRIVEEDVPVVATYLMINQQLHMLHRATEKTAN